MAQDSVTDDALTDEEMRPLSDEEMNAKPAPEKKSFVREAVGRVADFGKDFAEKAKTAGGRLAALASEDPAMASRAAAELGASAKEGATALAHPFAEYGREVADEVTHPKRTLQGAPLARWAGYATPEAQEHAAAVRREAVRGIQSNIPLAGLAHERLTGFPEESPADVAEAPHARGAGGALGTVALAVAPKAVPLVGRQLGKVANTAQDAVAATSGAVSSGLEGSVARSAARKAASPNPVRASFEAAVDKIKEDAGKAIEHGHSPSYTVAAARLAKPAVVAVDEKIAAIARRLGVKPREVADAMAAEGGAEVPVSATMRQYQEALANATTAEDKATVRAAIKGLQEREARDARKPAQAAPPPPEISKLTPEEMRAEVAQSSMPKARVEEPDVDFEIEEQPVEHMPASKASAPPEATEAVGGMPDRAAETHPEIATASRDMSTNRRRVGLAEGRPFEEPAKKVSMSGRNDTGTYQRAVDKLAQAAKKADNQGDFVREAVAGGLDSRAARKIWRAAHPYKPKPKATAAPTEAEELNL